MSERLSLDTLKHHAKRTKFGTYVPRCGSWSEITTTIGSQVTCPECKRLLRGLLG